MERLKMRERLVGVDASINRFSTSCISPPAAPLPIISLMEVQTFSYPSVTYRLGHFLRIKDAKVVYCINQRTFSPITMPCLLGYAWQSPQIRIWRGDGFLQWLHWYFVERSQDGGNVCHHMDKHKDPDL